MNITGLKPDPLIPIEKLMTGGKGGIPSEIIIV